MTRFEPDADPVPRPVREFVGLFDQQLPEAGFPDVSSASLAERIDAVQQHHERVAEALELLTDAQATLAAGQAALLEHAQRGLRYARVFAEGNDSLTQRLDELGLPSSTRPERRVRKRRAKLLTTAKSSETADPVESKPKTPSDEDAPGMTAAE